MKKLEQDDTGAGKMDDHSHHSSREKAKASNPCCAVPSHSPILNHMAGDGVNDSPALTQANVDIAMGVGADVALESADITLVFGDLIGVLKARHLSKLTAKNIYQGLFLAFGYNALAIPIAAGILYPSSGIFLNPMLAGLAMAFSFVSVIFNALRLAKS